MTALNLNGYTELPPGKIAAIVTSLEMRAPPPPRPTPANGVALARRMRPDLDWYRTLYRAVGEDWLWFSRMAMTDAQLADAIQDPHVEVYAIEAEGREIGLAELDFRMLGEGELAFFGLVREAVGAGAGRAAMSEALALLWRDGVERVWVHTCTLDHPAALDFYLRSGFTPYRRAIEVVDDPRLTGVLGRDAAPRTPIL